jgi:drug/metabolite transporter (DMT)-like permease
MQSLTRQQWLLLVVLTLIWGLNWPVMKLGVTGFPPLTFRTLCMSLGLPFLALLLYLKKIPFHVPRAQWRELAWLSFYNMLVWHVTIIIALQDLSSGRAAILGYTMPIFSAVLGVWLFQSVLSARAWMGVAAAGLGVLLLLWHEFTHLSGKPMGVLLALVAALAWAQGTQMMRRTRMTVPTLTIAFWMITFTLVFMALLAILFESSRWKMPSTPQVGAILYNAFGVFVFSQAAWLSLARHLPPVASTLSVMFIPILGVFSGAWWLQEKLHWQDWAAVALIVVAIASVLWPTRPAERQT